MIKRLIFLLSVVFVIFTACDKDDDPIPPATDQTVFMYLPWSTDLTSHFMVNISDFETSIKKNGLNGQRVLVFLSNSTKEATLYELQYNKGNVERVILKNYTEPPFTTAEGITSILNDVKSFSPTNRYAMTIGCHGMGWIPVSRSQSRTIDMKMHWDFEEGPMTRYFGARTPEFQTDITTLAEGIANSAIGKMEYILFDDCYMSTIEVAYDLKNVTDYLIGCPTEVMAFGMPYEKIGPYLIGNVDYSSICDAFLDFYENYTYKGEPYPHGTIAVTKCSEVDKLAEIMNRINKKFTFDPSKLSSIQKMDGYSPIIFFDFGDYVTKLCPDTELLEEFRNQLDKVVPYKKHTEEYYTGITYQKIPIKTFSGMTISDPSTHYLTSTKNETAWYKVTHN